VQQISRAAIKAGQDAAFVSASTVDDQYAYLDLFVHGSLRELSQALQELLKVDLATALAAR